MSSKNRQNAKQSRKWFAPFSLGILVGVVLTLVLGQFRREMDDEATVANAALEGARPLEQDTLEQPAAAPELAGPEPQPEVAAAPPTAAEPAAKQPNEPTEPSQPAAAADRPLLASPAAPSARVASAPAASAPPAAAPATQPTHAPPQATPAGSVKAPAAPMFAAAEKATSPQSAAPVVPAAPQLPAASSIVHAQPPTAAVPPAAAAQPQPSSPSTPVDPNSEEAKLAAAAQVRVRGDTPIDSMLDQALTPDKKAPAPAAPAPAVLAQTPSRDDVVNTMSVLVPAIRGCAQGQSGLAPMSIVVLSDGRVESAVLGSGPFLGTASGRCMEGVVRRAKFPHFKQANFRVQFPFAVQ